MKNKRYIPTLWTLVFLVMLLTLAFPATAIQAQCNMSPSNLNFNLPQAGGNETKTFILSNCTGTVSYYPANYTEPSWVDINLDSSGVTVSTNSANTSSSDRSTGFAIYVDGLARGGVTITQQGNAPPPPACTVNYANQEPFSWQGGSKDYTLTYSNCDNNLNPNYSFSVVSGATFATLTPIDKETIRVSVPSYNSTTSRVSVISVTDNNGYFPSFALQIVQECNAQNWYTDSDNDGLRDPGSTAVLDCANPGLGWTTNTTVDPCPSDVQNLCNLSLSENPDNHNYIYTRSYQQPRQQANAFFTDDDGTIQEITFFDGLGRPLQQVALAHSPNPQGGVMQDLVTHMTYDSIGRMDKEWLPYPSTGTMGNFRPNAQLDTKAYYNTNDYDNTQNPYSEKAFETSPLDRVLKQGAPGNDWQLGTDDTDHTVGFVYAINTHDPYNVSNPDNDNVRFFEVDLSAGEENPSLDVKGYYTPGELTKTIVKDENHTSGKVHTTEEFVDKQGRTILKRAYVDMEALVINWDGDTDETHIGERPAMTNVIHDTYYVYDNYGNLTYVLPPKVDLTDNAVSTTELEALCYQYRYDHRNRLIEKRIPGKQGWEHIVYNKLDQPILTQDPNQAAQGEWLFTKYDVYGRVAYTGKAQAIPSATRADIQAEVDGISTDPWVIPNSTAQSFGNALVNYNDGAYPTSNSNKTQLSEVLTINYYDNYDFDRAGAALAYSPFGVATTTKTQGLATGSKVRVLGTNDWITTVTHYDAKARPIHVYTKNEYLTTVDIVSSKLDFIGKPTKVRSAHTRGTNTVVTLDNYTYDTQGRLETHDQCVGDGTLGETCANANTTEQLVSNTYNGLGQLQRKTVGGGLQDVDYRYNVRGWLTGINDNDPNHSGFLLYGDLWGFRIHYNTPHNYGYNQNPKALYNG
ncbi:MAG: DUF6443 domain-containing protein, partial [Bacteroidota bacterium]